MEILITIFKQFFFLYPLGRIYRLVHDNDILQSPGGFLPFSRTRVGKSTLRFAMCPRILYVSSTVLDSGRKGEREKHKNVRHEPSQSSPVFENS